MLPENYFQSVFTVAVVAGKMSLLSFAVFKTAIATKTMKGTEVPNPRRSSACDCTCVLTRNRSLSRDSLMLAMCILFCSCPCKVRSQVSDTLSQSLCNLSLAFLADF